MRRLLVLILVMWLWTGAAAGEDPLAEWPYRLKLRVTTPELADFTEMAQLHVNLGPKAAPDCADVLLLDDKLREQPWRLLSATSTGDLVLLFRTVKGVRDYTLLFGKPNAQRPSYGVRWPLGKVLIDDFLPEKAYIHGLWSWVKTPVLSGVYAHTSPVTDRFNYHGTSEIRGVYLSENTRLTQYVMLDEKRPPAQVVLRLVFEKRSGANVWEDKNHLNLYWGEWNIKGLAGRAIRIGELPKPGKWERLSVRVGDLLRRADFRWQNGQLPDLFGIEFCTDKGRAWWDVTTVHEAPAPDREAGGMPAETEIVGLSRTSTAVEPTFVYQRPQTFKTPGTSRVLSAVRFFPTAPPGTTCRWDFGDGTTAEVPRPEHVFEGTGTARVSLVVREPDGKVGATAVELKGLETGARETPFAIELVSCPLIVRADEKALFNLRLEGNLRSALPLEVAAVLLDPNDKQIRSEEAHLTMLPGLKHPTFISFSLDLGAENVSRIRFEMRLERRLLAKRVVTLHSSRSTLKGVKLAGDRYLDQFGNPAVIRCEIAEAPGGPVRRSWDGFPREILVIGGAGLSPAEGLRPAGGLAGETLVDHLRKALETSTGVPDGTAFKTAGVEALPAWSMPFRQTVAPVADEIQPTTDVVIVASTVEMMLGGVPARTGVDAVGVVVDQIRRRSGARVLLLTPTIFSGSENLARQYTVHLRMLGIEKNVHVVDVYSRSMRLTGEDPELLKTARVADGVLTQALHPRMVREVVDALIEDLRGVPEIPTSP
ncbi:MAG TPA: PKD domain-containing protein [Planctomycetota bacterium]|nr:PKD domain-containing protein [Planctomycetota bacterium]